VDPPALPASTTDRGVGVAVCWGSFGCTVRSK
jgi:hypothetical protein